MTVYFPVDSGAMVELQVSCYLDPQRDRPVNGYIIGGGSPELNRSLELGAEVAYERARQHFSSCGDRSYTLAVELKRRRQDVDLGGESGGLAFALACFAEIAKVDYGCSVAATGRLAGMKDGGKIETVGALAEKLEGLLLRLEPGSKIFLPVAGQYDLPTELATEFQVKNISVFKVETVQQALDILMGKGLDAALPATAPAGKKRRWVARALLSLLVMAGLLAGLYFQDFWKDREGPDNFSMAEPQATVAPLEDTEPPSQVQFSKGFE